MALFDLPLADLERYRPDVDVPADLDDFWAGTLAQARGHDLALRTEVASPALRHVAVHDVTFAGFDGHPIKAWYARPAGVRADLPVVVSYIGYSGGRSLPTEHTLLPSAGYAYLKVDSRGQGWGLSAGGDTADPVGSDPAVPGMMTRGIGDPYDYYYRRLFTDAARAVDAARALPGTDPDRVVVSGGSQGGALAIAAAALVPDVAGLMTDVPFLQHIRRAVEITDGAPYREITTYLATHRDHAEKVWRTLSYVDGVSLAARGRAPSLWSVALMDMTCPPSTVYASFNAYPGPKEIEVYPWNAHEGGGPFQVERQLRWLADLLA